MRLLLRRHARHLVLICALASACQPDSPQHEALHPRAQEVVYGEDGRRDWFELEQDQQRLLREAIGVLVNPNDIDDSDPDDVRLEGGTLEDAKNLCEGEPFADQPSVGRCSATLIDDDLALTAGHCIPSQRRCANRRLVFNFYYEASEQLATVTASDIYRCEELIAVFDDDNGEDFAIFRLDRPVNETRRPVNVRAFDDPLPLNAAVSLVGFPNGIPAKWDDGGMVSRPRADQLDYFEATVDAFSGNSGAGVFDGDHTLVGILVRGRTDYNVDEEAECSIVNTLPTTEENAEDITYVGRAIEALCRQGSDSARLCLTSTRGLCFPCAEDDHCRPDWSCVGDDPEFSTCAPPCADDRDCRDDHTCGPLGQCAPRQTPRCLNDTVWLFDGCERQIALIESCDDSEFCAGGQCRTPGMGDICETAITLQPITQRLQQQLDLSFSDQHVGSCESQGPDRHYTFQLETPQRLTASITATTEGFEPVLSLRGQCDNAETELECVESPDPIDVELMPGAYSLIVDAQGEVVGDFELELGFEPLCSETRCQLGESRCLDTRQSAICTLDERGCFEFSTTTSCADDDVCVNGQCQQPIPGDACSDPLVLTPTSQQISGDLNNATSALETSCGGNGRDIIYSLTLPEPSSLSAALTTDATGASLTLMPDCGAQPPAQICAQPNPSAGLFLEVDITADTWLIVVDLGEDAEALTFNLLLELSPICNDACDAGASRCDSDISVARCETLQGDCLQWAVAERCGDSERCLEGSCVLACDDPCGVVDQQRCDGESGLQTCTLDPLSDCLSWSTTPCQANTTCDIDRCSAPPLTASHHDSGCQVTPAKPARPFFGLLLLITLLLTAQLKYKII